MTNLIALALFLSLAAQKETTAPSAPNAVTAAATAPNAAPEPATVPDLAAHRKQLLDLGRDAAESIPVDPHERDRARVQEVVAQAAITLGDLKRAERCAEQITTWRRGAVHGELAAVYAERGDRAEAERFMRLAQELGPRILDWQRDRIRVGVARAQAILGETERVRELEAVVNEAERGKITAARAAKATPEQFGAILEDVRRATASGSLDATAAALETCAELAALLDADESRWSEIDAVFTAANGKVARELYIGALLRLADVRLDDVAVHAAAREKASTLIAQAKAVRDAVRWATESELPITASIAQRMARAEGRDAGVAELERGVAAFKENEEHVANVFRGQALRPAAEAFVALGAHDRAIEIYRWAIEAGALNPNARPRAEDIAQTCASLAISGIEPDEAMWARLAAIRAGLTTPW
ncbi:MAG: hypothetical protein ACKO3W_02240 [bacterium]